jgi:predicted DNA-binding protein YlxM (UPF0122 family)
MTDKKKLTPDEVAKILRYADDQQIKLMMEKGIIPAIQIDKGSFTTLASDLADFLKIENIDEPFMTSAEVQQFLGLALPPNIIYCKRKGIPFTTVGPTEKGKRLLFRKSLLEKWIDNNLILTEDFTWFEETTRVAFQRRILEFVYSFIEILGLTEFQQVTLQQYIYGDNVKDIAKKYSVSETTINQIINKSIQKIIFVFRRFNNFHEDEMAREFFRGPKQFLVNYREVVSNQGTLIEDLKNRIIELEAVLQKNNISSYEISGILRDEDYLFKRKLLMTDLEDLGTSVRLYNCLKAAKIKNLAEVVQCDINDLLKFRNFGRKSIAEIHELLAEKGFYLGMDLSPYLLKE